jgi:hypothetical protein
LPPELAQSLFLFSMKDPRRPRHPFASFDAEDEGPSSLTLVLSDVTIAFVP